MLRDQPEPDQRVVIALWHDKRLTVSLCYWDSQREIEEGKGLDNLRPSLLRSLPLWHNTAGVWIDHNDVDGR